MGDSLTGAGPANAGWRAQLGEARLFAVSVAFHGLAAVVIRCCCPDKDVVFKHIPTGGRVACRTLSEEVVVLNACVCPICREEGCDYGLVLGFSGASDGTQECLAAR